MDGDKRPFPLAYAGDSPDHVVRFYITKQRKKISTIKKRKHVQSSETSSHKFVRSSFEATGSFMIPNIGTTFEYWG